MNIFQVLDRLQAPPRSFFLTTRPNRCRPTSTCCSTLYLIPHGFLVSLWRGCKRLTFALLTRNSEEPFIIVGHLCLSTISDI